MLCVSLSFQQCQMHVSVQNAKNVFNVVPEEATLLLNVHHWHAIPLSKTAGEMNKIQLTMNRNDNKLTFKGRKKKKQTTLCQC